MPPKTKKPLSDEQKEQIKATKVRRLYIFEEVCVLLCTLAGVVVSEALQKRAAGKPVFSGDFLLDLPNFVVSVVVALIYYGTLYSNFKDFSMKRPPLAKRISFALLTGVAWRTLTNSI